MNTYVIQVHIAYFKKDLFVICILCIKGVKISFFYAEKFLIEVLFHYLKGGHFARKPIGLKLTPPGQQQQQSHESQQQQNSGRSTRQLFGEEECYVIDAKSYGNVGRYLNVSIKVHLM